MAGLRPEDRCRGAEFSAPALDAGVDCHRSEAFAEDLPAAAALAAAATPRQLISSQRRSAQRASLLDAVWTAMRTTPAA